MTMTLSEAQADLAGVIHRLTADEELIITEGDRPVARLRAEPPPKQPQPREPGLWKGKVTVLTEDDDHLAAFAEYMP